MKTITKKKKVNKKSVPKTYEFTLRGKHLFTECETIDDMIGVLKSTISTLQDLKGRDVKLSHGQQDDYSTLTTTDQEVADEFGFEPPF